jgi:exopolyphosphatase/pppGpp-phosphohydrolase
MAETANTTLAAGVAKTGKFDPKVIDDTAAAVKGFYEKMKTVHGIAADRISVVGSSGLFAAIQEKPELIEANQKALADAVAAAVNVKIQYISAKREAELSIEGIMPRKYRDAAILIDIGSGNTKGGYKAADGAFATMSAPFGTVTFSERVKKAEGNYAEAAKSLRESLLRPSFEKELATLKEIDKRRRVYLSGGIVWAASTFSRPGESSAFTRLTVADIDGLLAKLAARNEYPTPELASIADEAKRKNAAEEIEKVKKVFTPDQLHAGLHLLKALAAEMKLDREGEEVYFARHGYLGWILAYVAEKGAAKP